MIHFTAMLVTANGIHSKHDIINDHLPLNIFKMVFFFIKMHEDLSCATNRRNLDIDLLEKATREFCDFYIPFSREIAQIYLRKFQR